MWHIIERYYETINYFHTIYGHLWYINMYVFRMFVIVIVGDDVYGDEMSQFKCDTVQPGCSNVCFNSFSPIPHMRFWALQVLFCTLPIFGFYSYISKILKMIRREDPMKKEGFGSVVYIDVKNGLKYDPEVSGKLNKLYKTEMDKRVLKLDKFYWGSEAARPNLPDFYPAYKNAAYKATTQKNREKKKLLKNQTGAFGREIYGQNGHSSEQDYGSVSSFGTSYSSARLVPSPAPIQKVEQKLEVKDPPKETNKIKTITFQKANNIRLAYIICCLSKIFFELFFIYWAYYLQFLQSRKKSFWDCFTVPEKYICLHGLHHENQPNLSPCSQQGEVSCWISRPKEKEFFLRYMLVSQFLSVGLAFLDMVKVFWKMVVKDFGQGNERDFVALDRIF